MSSRELIPVIVATLARQSPAILVCLGGCIAIVTRWSRLRRAALPALGGFALALFLEVFGLLDHPARALARKICRGPGSHLWDARDRAVAGLGRRVRADFDRGVHRPIRRQIHGAARSSLKRNCSIATPSPATRGAACAGRWGGGSRHRCDCESPCRRS